MYEGIRYPIMESRIDWLTATSSDPARRSVLGSFGKALLAEERVEGNDQTPFTAHGATGNRCGHVEVAEGSEWSLLRVRSDLAHRVAPAIATWSDRWTRVDYCVTIIAPPVDFDPTEDYWAEWHRLWPDSRQRSVLGRYQDTRMGRTIYIGKRASAIYNRCYNKHVESRGRYPPGSWRWEVELKKERANLERDAWINGPRSNSSIASVVAHGWSRQHLTVPWQTEIVSLPSGRVRRRSDADRRLSWYERQVAPTIAQVIAARGRRAVMESLGLWDT